MNQRDTDTALEDVELRTRANALLERLDRELGKVARTQLLNAEDLYDEAGLPR